MILAFDADVLIYAAETNHPLGEKVLRILENPQLEGSRMGSALLLPELLSKPIRLGLNLERDSLLNILTFLDLIPLDTATAMVAAQLGAVYKLKAPDAIHLATAFYFDCPMMFTFDENDVGEGKSRPKRGLIPLTGLIADRYEIAITKPYSASKGLGFG